MKQPRTRVWVAKHHFPAHAPLETILATGRSGLARWRKLLFVYMARNARPANAFFRIPSNRVVELGAQVEI